MVSCIPIDLWHDLGRSWMLPLLDTLKTHQQGFNQLKEQLGISSKVLQERLTVLEQHEFIVWHKDPEGSEFMLTAKAHDFLAVWHSYVAFINKHYPDLPCGTVKCANCPQLK